MHHCRAGSPNRLTYTPTAGLWTVPGRLLEALDEPDKARRR